LARRSFTPPFEKKVGSRGTGRYGDVLDPPLEVVTDCQRKVGQRYLQYVSLVMRTISTIVPGFHE
jgi:hypothetical protein